MRDPVDLLTGWLDGLPKPAYVTLGIAVAAVMVWRAWIWRDQPLHTEVLKPAGAAGMLIAYVTSNEFLGLGALLCFGAGAVIDGYWRSQNGPRWFD